jgi:homoserine kinase
VAGVLLADQLSGRNTPEPELLRLMTAIEGHPDNVVPCYLGGMTVSCWDGADLRYVRLPPLPEDLLVVAAVPDIRVRTSDARRSLPYEVPFGDAVFNLGRAALLCAAWATGQWELLSWGMEDRLHQVYRSRLFPGGDVIMERVRRLSGCFGVAISGSGPTIVALVRGAPGPVASVLCRTFSEYGVTSRFFVLQGCAGGARFTLDREFFPGERTE